MQLKSINFMLLALFMSLSMACTKKATSEGPGRSIDVVPIDDTGDVEDDVTIDDDDSEDVEDVDRSDSDDESPDDTIDDTENTVNTNNVLFNSYRNVIPTTKVCNNILNSRSASTLKKFFGWDITNLEGPVTICVEQETSTPRCSSDEDYCDDYPSRHVRIRIEYEDDFRFWYYDSEKSTNYAKLLSYTGGSGANTLEIILQDGAGFLRVDGYKTSSGAYDVSMAFADRPTYSKARAYDVANNFGENSSGRRAATLWDMKVCASSASGNAKYSDGSDCAARFVFAYQFFADLNTEYPTTGITDTALWVRNQVTIARQYVTNQFPTQFSSFEGYQSGTFGRLLLNGL